MIAPVERKYVKEMVDYLAFSLCTFKLFQGLNDLGSSIFVLGQVGLSSSFRHCDELNVRAFGFGFVTAHVPA